MTDSTVGKAWSLRQSEFEIAPCNVAHISIENIATPGVLRVPIDPPRCAAVSIPFELCAPKTQKFTFRPVAPLPVDQFNHVAEIAVRLPRPTRESSESTSPRTRIGV
ncbi:MAG: hypothetical protein MUQ48_08865, partial [Pirellulales bacterium]|nr:hypothetical protein [Pirellulales bacterium]